MFIDQFPKLTYDEIRSVEWQGDAEQYDIELSTLASKYQSCLVINQDLENQKLPFFINELPEHDGECIVWHYRDIWVAKIFFKGWSPEKGYINVKIPVPNVLWKKNPDIDNSMTFFDNPMGIFEPDPWDCDYQMIWYMDTDFVPSGEKIWVMSCEVLGGSDQGIKEMGYLTPQVEIETNPELPDLGIDLASCCPPYWDLSYECAYFLDTVHTKDLTEKLWVVKFAPTYRKTKGWKWLGSVSPQPNIIYNTDLGILNFDVDLSQTNWYDLQFENVYMLDKKFLSFDSDDVIAFRVQWTTKPQGAKIMGYIDPEPRYEINPDLSHLDIDLGAVENFLIDTDNWHTKFTWLLDPNLTGNHRIWVAKKSIPLETNQEHEQGFLVPVLPDQLDVVFISYQELDAEENFQRLITKAPWAKRVQGVKGIFEAHLAAAKLSETDIFYVVDGDAWITDKFDFDYHPGIFDLDCTYIWNSINPVNGLKYGYGGVKLFNKHHILNSVGWNQLDMTTTVNTKIKVINAVSNETRFNSDEFNTWRSAFRECVKLCYNQDLDPLNKEHRKRLEIWKTVGQEKEHGKYSIDGANYAVSYYDANKGNLESLKMINDIEWLKNEFKQYYRSRYRSKAA